ncbi:glycoside hydrolase family 133 protein [Sphaerobolus stellatus SS14]|nr:glycoside hydrolase family 133 protein [Sphaerobolus stellatus SS14]
MAAPNHIPNGGTVKSTIAIQSPVSIEIPASPFVESAKTPRTPADEGIQFFESPLGHGEQPIQVYELQLDPDGGPNKARSYISLPPPIRPYILRMTLDAGTPASRNAVLKTNFPLDGGSFLRDKFVEKKLPTDFSKSIHINLPISHAGAFVYWIEYDGAAGGRVIGREGYFNIDPVLRIKARSSILSQDLKPLPPVEGGKVLKEEVALPLDGLVILTVVSKWMGELSEWREYLKEASERGYNMLHYTPLQQCGESGSPYSIAEQLAFDEKLVGKVPKEEGVKKVREALKVAYEEFGLLSLTDVVMNHTANNSPWLLSHPEAGFSPFNTPHLAPALELDNAILEFSGNLSAMGLPTRVESQSDLDILLGSLSAKVRDELQLWKYYVLDRNHEQKAILAALEAGVPEWTGPNVRGKSVEEIATYLKDNGKIDGLAQYKKKYGVTIDSKFAASIVRAAFPDYVDNQELARAWLRIVDTINVPLYAEWEEDTRVALDNIRNRVDYTRMAEHGPKLGKITASSPLVESYFTRLPQNELTSKHDPSALALANNGWIWDADPLQNFALLPSKSYLRREVIVWGDCVKLRYGSGPQDNPWLWEYMTKYVTSLASMFNGFRIDNCHSTPLHVGVALLDAARAVNPDLYICAELFTGNEDTDIHFVSRLGINSLIREAYNGHDPKDLSRLLYRFGVGRPIGSMNAACLTSPEDLPPPTGKGPTRPCLVTPLRGSAPNALFFDVTHDNESPLHKRSAEDALSTGALVAMSGAAIGSNKGFDDLYPKLLDLVGENRKYQKYEKSDETGISSVKRVLNHLHGEMVLGGYSEGHVHQENDYISIHRVNPLTGEGYLLIAHTAFHKGSKDRGWVGPTKLSRTDVKFILGAAIEISSYTLEPNDKYLTGLLSKLVELETVNAHEGSDENGAFSEITVPDYFPPGAILLYSTQLHGVDRDLDQLCKNGAEDAFKDLDLVDLNAILHRADGEERDATQGEIGTYNVPGYSNLVYAGLEGWMAPLRKIMWDNDLGHALCHHLREGSWALDYIVNRLEKQVDVLPRLAVPAAWFKERFDRIKATLPPFLRPKYFAIVVYEAYKAARRAVIEQYTEFVSGGHTFIQDLALCSVQMYGLVRTASLDPAKPVPSLAAGLPHFTAGWARCWGRDVFISLRGLFLTTGNFDAAKEHILAFASTLKHGLIPNLLDSVRSPRYNSRDSPWWMVQNIQDYVSLAPDGIDILSEPVKRRFPKDDTWVPWDDPKAYAYTSTIAEIIQEILQRHATGISFREYNAGPNLDMQMSDKGFNIDIYVDWDTGLIFGGNKYNCGTWMDKMGESVKAGTKGVPGTPRDGAPVEIIGLLKSTLRWLADLSSKGKFPFKGVQATIDGKERLVTYKEWSDLLQASFERCYYVPSAPPQDSKYVINSKLVNRRGIYKDVFGSGEDHEWADYQLRPNFPIAMAVAPELFDPVHALGALKMADAILRGPLGMKTLDSSDLQYRGDYDNSNDSTDPSIAKGLNYHNGPEWGWPLGYFLRAYLHFDTKVGSGKKDITNTLHYIYTTLLGLQSHIQNDVWRGLPELTNHDGAFCPDSCATQAWSSSTILDLLHDVRKLSLSQAA